MARHFRTRRTLSAPVNPRQKVWARSSFTEPAPTTTFWSHDMLQDQRASFGIGFNLPGFTIGPFHIKFSIRITIPHAALTGAEGVQVGLIVGRINIPVTALSYPNIDGEDDWIWNEWCPVETVLVSTTPVPLPGDVIITKEIHTKAMRKLGEIGQTCFFIVVPTGGATLAQCTIGQNTMIRLP